MEFNHTSVLLRETVGLRRTNPKGIYVDCTLVGQDMLTQWRDARPRRHDYSLDQDEDALSIARQRFI